MKITIFSFCLIMTSLLSKSNAQCAAVNVPYVENFEAVTSNGDIPPCTTQQVINGLPWGVYNSSYGTTGRSVYITIGSSDADSWFYTQGVNLQAGKVYKLAFDYVVFTPQSLSLSYGTSPVNTSMTNVIQNISLIAVNTFTPVSFTFTPSVTGVYYFGFNYKGGDIFIPALTVDNISVTLQSTLSTSEIQHLKDDVEVYPNPAKDDLLVKNSQKNTGAEILDILGRVVLSLDKINEKIDVSQLVKGTYFLVIKNEDGTLSKTKFIKK